VRKGELQGRLDAEYYVLISNFSSKSPFPSHSIGSQFYIRDGDHNKFPPAHSSDAVNGVRYLRAQDLKDGEIVDSNPIYVSKEYFSKIKRSEIKSGYILFSIMASVGGVVVYPDNREDCTANRAIGILIPKKSSQVLPHFFKALFNTPFGETLIRTLKKGGVQQRVNLFDFGNLRIPVPPKELQAEIINRFETAHNRKRIKEANAKAMLFDIDEYVLERLGMESPVIANNPKIFYRKLSELSGGRFDANSYNTERLVAIEAIKRGKYPSKKLKFIADFSKTVISEVTNLPYVGLENIESNTGNYIETTDKQSFGTAVVFKGNQVLFPKLRPYLNKVYLAEFDGVCSTEFHVLDSKTADLTNQFLATFLRSRVVVSQTKHLMSGNTLPRLQTEDIENLLIPLPPISLQQEIASHIQSVKVQARELEREARAEFEKAKEEVENMILGEVGV
jgi:restriction endonuclease S subunit